MAEEPPEILENESYIMVIGSNNSLTECLAHQNLSLPSPKWVPNRSPIEMCKLAVNILGIIGNLALFIILRRRHLGSRLATLFFSCQSILDLMVCLMSAAHIVQPALWLVGDNTIGQFLICHGWHSLVLYLFFVQYSIVNIVLIGLERYWAVVKPIMYQKLSIRRHGWSSIAITLTYSAVFAIPNLWETKYIRTCGIGLCISQSFSPEVGLMLKIYSVMWFIFIFFLPLLLLIFFYARVIAVLRSSQTLAPCSKKDKAAAQFTRMAICVTIVYVLCITYDAFAYMLGRTGVIQYTYNSVMHALGMFVISLNSCANPYIYFFFVMRTSFMKMLRRRNRQRANNGYYTVGLSRCPDDMGSQVFSMSRLS